MIDLSTLQITDTPAGCRLRLRVRARARRAGIVGVHGGALKLRVGAPPERDRANCEVLDLLAAAAGLAAARLRLVAGETSPDKVVQFEGVGGAELMRRLTASTRSGR